MATYGNELRKKGMHNWRIPKLEKREIKLYLTLHEVG